MLDSAYLLFRSRKRNDSALKSFEHKIEGRSKENTIGICVHHYSKRNLRFDKVIHGNKFELGLEGICAQSSISRFINKSSEDISKEYLFDFYTYLCEELREDVGVFMNDNVSLDFNLKAWETLSLYLIKSLDVGLVGIGCNSFLTQSLFFPRQHAPHVQTYLFSIDRKIWNKFRLKMLWYRKVAALPSSIGKQLVCRILEQGVTRYCLRDSRRIALVRENNVYIFSAEAWNSRSVSWPLEKGDYRYKVGEKAFKFTGWINYNIHIYE